MRGGIPDLQNGNCVPDKRCSYGILNFMSLTAREQKCVPMAKVCEICGRGPQFGHRISHAHNVTKRRWNLNLQTVHALIKGAGKRVRVCTSCIRDGKVQKAPLA